MTKGKDVVCGGQQLSLSLNQHEIHRVSEESATKDGCLLSDELM